MDSGYEAPTTRESIAHIFPLFPRELRADLRKFLEAEEPAARLGASLGLCEILTVVVNRRLLTTYEGNTSDRSEDIEKDLLRTPDAGKLAFGQEVGFLREYVKSAPSLDILGGSGIAATPCPPPCDALQKCWKLVKDARKDFRSTPEGARAYATPRIQKGSIYLLDFLGVVVELRNAQAHRKDPRWSSIWDDGPEWFRLLDDFLHPAVLALLLWEPLQPILTGWEEVRVESSRQLGPSRWRSDVTRDLDEVPIGGRVLDTVTELVAGRSYILKRSERRLQAPPREVFTRAAVVETRQAAVRERLERQLTAYRGAFVAHVLSCAILDRKQDDGLHAEQRQRGIDDDAARRVREECWAVLRAALSDRRTEAATSVLKAWIGEVNDDPLDVRLDACVRRIEAAVRQLVDEVTADGTRVVLVAEVARELGIDVAVAERELAKVAVGTPEDPPGATGPRSYVEIFAPAQAQSFREVVQASIKDAQAGVNFWRQDRTLELMKLLNQALPDAYRQALQELQEYVPRTVADSRPQRAPARTVDISLSGKALSIGSVADFFRQLFDEIGHEPAFLASLPWKWGRVRRLAAATPGEEGDRNAMTYPVGVPEGAPAVYFDANATREEVAYCVVQNLRDAQLVAALIVAPSDAWVAAEAIAGVDVVEGDINDDFGVVLSVPGSDSSLTVAAHDPTVFAARWLKSMLDKGLLPYRELPIRLGRSQTLLSLRPEHGRPDRPFERAVHYRGVYMDTAMSGSSIVGGVLSALAELEIPARSLRSRADSGDEEDEETEGPRAWYVNVGGRSWRDMRRHGFWQAGGGTRYRDAVLRLREGDEVYAYVSGRGYVGFGVVSGARASKLDEFVGRDLRGLADCDVEEQTRGAIERSRGGSDELAEYAAAINWEATRDVDDAVRMRGMFTTPLTACRLTHQATIDFVRSSLTNGSISVGPAADAVVLQESVARFGVWPERWGKPKVLSLLSGDVLISRWNEVLVRVAEALLAEGVLAADAQPEGTGRVVLSRADSTGMLKPHRLSNGWWIETNWSATDCVKIAGGLLKASGRDPGAFSVRYAIARAAGAPEAAEADATEEPA